MSDVGLSLDFLSSQSAEGLILLFWFTLCLEIPRYLCGFAALGLAAASAEGQVARAGYTPLVVQPSVSVIVVGHNEADALERCLLSLREQNMRPSEVVVVSDGSTDGMGALATGMVRRGLAQHALATDLRSGKSAGFNLALRTCRGDIIVVVDCDCSYDRFALENIVAPFADARVGAVSGDLTPRNGHMSLIARLQAIEYLLSISVGRRVASGLNQVSCISGAFGAYRRTAVEDVGGYDVGGGEDLDLTLRLRNARWGVAFAPSATCHTDVPVRLWILVRQRLRWERDALRLRCRKHRRTLMLSGRPGGFAGAVNQCDYLVFELGATLAFPIYLAWLVSFYGALALPVLVAMQFGLLLLDTVGLALSALVVPRSVSLSTLLYLPGYALYAGYVTRTIRLLAFVHEIFLFGSRNDNFVPDKVRSIRKW
jgi:cellulose synthase/poly-beta-1,6-N-acetylglucosamine synthase-like glycosyltransferase